jgi:signal transduction histidine kinase/phage shock protein PspC (stress-responsive transcriptional regulator)
MTIEPTTALPRPPDQPARPPGPPFAYQPRRLYRDRDGRVVAGVAAGLAEHLRLPTVVVRVAFVALLVANGLGALLYIGFWAVLPVAPRTKPRRRPAGTTLQAIGLFALGAGVILLQLQFNGFGLDATLVGLITLVALGAGIIWHQADPQRRRREPEPTRASALRRAVEGESEGVRRWYLVRMLGGGLLIIVGIIGILGFFAPFGNVDFSDVLLGLIFSLLALSGLVLTLAPLLNRVFGQLREERVARIREQERAEVAAMVHDQVLHTLALIQRSSADPASVVRLARGQERSLRNWLYKPSASPTERFAAALEQAAAEVEDAFAITVETVIVGDADNNESVAALVAATREALVNAARHAKVGTVSLYAEAEEETLSVYVRDRGVGFDMSTMDDDRHGVRGSIIGRMRRHGGQAQVRSAPGEGTEVELTLPRTKVTASESRQ